MDNNNPARYFLQSECGRMVTNDTRTGVALTSNVALAYVWLSFDDAERVRKPYEVLLGRVLAVRRYAV